MRMRFARTVPIVLTLAGATIIAGCERRSGDEAETTTDSLTAATPSDSAEVPVGDMTYVTNLMYFGSKFPTPLFQDRQKVASKDSDRYGGGVMWAAPATALDKLTLSSYVPGKLTAVAHVDVESSDSDYKEHNFKVGRNCIYITPKGNNPPASVDDLKAFVALVPVTTGEDCPEPNGARLPMRIISGGTSSRAGDIPPIVKIDQSYPNREILIGLQCLPNVWCEISKNGATSPESDSKSPKFRIKGWYDEQFLSIGTPTGLKPTELYAGIHPSDALPDLLKDPAKWKTWQTVAMITFRNRESTAATQQALNWYRDKKWSFAANVSISLDDTVYLELMSPDPNATKKDFVGRFRVRGHIGRNKKVTWHDENERMIAIYTALKNSPYSDPGIRIKIGVPATRWGWDSKDETGWTKCLAGCCEVTGDDDNRVIPAAESRASK
jgi:hypothetical protein